MTDEDSYALPPRRTQEDIDVLVSFIEERVQPLRNKVRFDSEEYKAFQGLLDVVAYSKGMAQAVLQRGGNPDVAFSYLTTVARNWPDHPVFLS